MTWEEEQAFLAPFFSRAERGDIATAGEIKRAFEAHLGHEVHKSTSLPAAQTASMAQAHAPSGPSASEHRSTRAVEKNFVESYEAAVATCPAEDTRSVLKMAQDEGRGFPHQYPRRAWAPPGVRPRAPRQVIRQSSYVFAAVAPEQGLMTSLILPSADTAMMNLFLAEARPRLCRLFYRHASRVMRAGIGPKI